MTADRSVDRHHTSTTAIRFDPELLDDLHAAALERMVSVNWLVSRLCKEGLAKLIPVDELRLTKP